MKHRCDEVLEKLSNYYDGVGSNDENTAIEKHLKECDRCAGEYKKLCALIGELNALPEKPLPADFEEKLQRRLSREGKPLRHINISQNWGRYSVIAAGLLLVIIVRAGFYDNISRYKTAYIDDAALEYKSDVEQNQVPAPTPSAEQKAITNAAVPSETEPVQAPSRRTPAQYSGMQNNDDTSDSQQNESNANEQAAAVPPESTTKQQAEQRMEQPMAQPSEGEQQEIANQKSDEDYAAKKNAPVSSRGMSELRGAAMPQESLYTIAHDNEAPSFVSVTVRVDEFEIVSKILEEEYNAVTENNTITLQLDAEQFTAVMNRLVEFGADVIQQETPQELTANNCVIMPKETTNN